MPMPEATVATETLLTLTRSRFDAVLFDLDGVLTKTAMVHARAWKAMFDDFLQEWARQTGQRQPPFDIDDDYARHVDGLPRLEGVTRFLASRRIALPPGQESDPPEAQTIAALGQRKNALQLDLIRRQGIEVYPTTVSLMRKLRACGFLLAIVSSSANCREILTSCGLLELFDARVDGIDLPRLHLRGKPAPDAFLEAARRIGVAPARAVVVEDAVSGVEAGHAGGFGAVIGVDRRGQGHSVALATAGATVVVRDLAQLDANNT